MFLSSNKYLKNIGLAVAFASKRKPSILVAVWRKKMSSVTTVKIQCNRKRLRHKLLCDNVTEICTEYIWLWWQTFKTAIRLKKKVKDKKVLHKTSNKEAMLSEQFPFLIISIFKRKGRWPDYLVDIDQFAAKWRRQVVNSSLKGSWDFNLTFFWKQYLCSYWNIAKN